MIGKYELYKDVDLAHQGPRNVYNSCFQIENMHDKIKLI